jgi:sulfur-oxidizing protein SoxY
MKRTPMALATSQTNPNRRRWLLASAAAASASLCPRLAYSQSTVSAPAQTGPTPAQAAIQAALQAAITSFTGGQPVRDGRVHLALSPLVENGNTVPVSVRVDSAMTPTDHVRRLALFAERNPQSDVAIFELSPLSGKAEVSTRMRLSTSQQVWALAELHDGSFWRHRVAVVVTLAACVEGDIGVP